MNENRSSALESRDFRILLVLIVAINLVNGALLAIIVPMWIGPDELAHYSDVQYLRVHGKLPDQRTCFLSEEVKGASYEADWWGILERKEKMRPGPETFYTHGFAAFGDCGNSRRVREPVHSGEFSLALAYKFTEEDGEYCCAYKTGSDVTGLDGFGLWVYGDGSNVQLQLSVESEVKREHYVRAARVDWTGWRDVFEPFSRFSEGLPNDLTTTATLKIYIADDPVSGTAMQGELYIDDIYLTRRGEKVHLTGFEDEELLLMPSDCYNWCAHHPPLYYLLMLPIDVILSEKPIFSRVLAMRLLTVLLSTGTIFLLALGGRLLFGTSSWVWLLVPSIFVFSPVYTFDQACVNNDHLMIFLYTLLLYMMLKWSEGSLDARRSLILGGLIGLGLMTKMIFITAVPLLFLFICLRVRKEGPGLLKRLFSRIGQSMIMILAITGWWFLRNCLMYGMPMVTATVIRPDEKLPLKISLFDILSSESLWAWISTGWFYRIASHTSFAAPEIVRYVTDGLMIIAGLGLLRALYLRLFLRRQLVSPRTAVRLRLLAYAVVIHTIVIFSQVARGTMNLGKFRAFNGRYLLPVALGIGALVAFCIENLLPEKFRRFGVLILICVLIFIELVTVHITMMETCYPF
ncbi:MAG: hypothetical protein JW941_12485 [Candidatus Coatesbacteria bacterium]|nr:hypothetical protein [Candidatus Coatesbacteria bacterium]